MNEHLEYYETVALMAKHDIKICLETKREKRKKQLSQGKANKNNGQKNQV